MKKYKPIMRGAFVLQSDVIEIRLHPNQVWMLERIEKKQEGYITYFFLSRGNVTIKIVDYDMENLFEEIEDE